MLAVTKVVRSPRSKVHLQCYTVDAEGGPRRLDSWRSRHTACGVIVTRRWVGREVENPATHLRTSEARAALFAFPLEQVCQHCLVRTERNGPCVT